MKFVNVSLPEPFKETIKKIKKENPNLNLTSNASVIRFSLRMLCIQSKQNIKEDTKPQS